MIERSILILLFVVIATNCTTVKPYQKMYLNDEGMQLSSRKIEQYEISSQNYREGASGANGSKAGGGCGCN
ncbi:DUF4266 domain-containing protein [Tenacibaculum maritimum]|uniref:DUF4266 domain-containing protein n=1 Tax=Tenacibaculum maritimum TaxID=107401 RepID=UPI0012E6556C|nr:DUF4266 domain-containing protein [Tenacibaculum maritimum]CAA0148226.1 conserved hypothetical protein [Tenacibaculum maritimum]CAA0215485.1 conserved hypothetical protein [Tenacibaculum maritimum]